jgi:hypothetical protein
MTGLPLTSCWSNGVFGDAHVRIGDMHPKRVEVAQTRIRVNAGRVLALVELNSFERRPRCVL